MKLKAAGLLSPVINIQYNYLKESTDIWFVVGAHENHVLEQPEERTVVALLWLQHGQYAVVLEKEPSGALCRTKPDTHTHTKTR